MKVEESSGNVFKDLGLPNAEELLAKAEIACQIGVLIKKKKLFVSKVAKLLKITSIEFLFFSDGNFDRFSLETLYRFKEILESSQNDKGEING